MIKNSNKNICIIVESLSFGGAERVAAILSEMLHNKGYLVTIISFNLEVSYSYSGRLIQLDKNVSKFKLVKQFQKFFRLKKHIKSKKWDYIIDFRFRTRIIMEALLHLFVWTSQKMIFTIHSYNVHWHIPNGRFFINRYKKQIITVTSNSIKTLLENKYNFKNVVYIPNAINTNKVVELSKTKKIEEDYIIAVGRLNNKIKQFDKLIDTYKTSGLIKKNVKLYILGTGKDKALLEKQINTLNLTQHIKLLGFKSNPYPYIKSAKFMVLCSKVEGFSMVILEALSLKTPVVSFNCKSGPSDLIINNSNGILVENQNFNALKETMRFLINNKSELDALAKRTNHNLDFFSTQNQYKLWNEILQ